MNSALQEQEIENFRLIVAKSTEKVKSFEQELEKWNERVDLLQENVEECCAEQIMLNEFMRNESTDIKQQYKKDKSDTEEKLKEVIHNNASVFTWNISTIYGP